MKSALFRTDKIQISKAVAALVILFFRLSNSATICLHNEKESHIFLQLMNGRAVNKVAARDSIMAAS